MENINVDLLIKDFYSTQIAKQLGNDQAKKIAIENARIHLNKLIVVVSDLGRKALALEYNKILLELNTIQFL